MPKSHQGGKLVAYVIGVATGTLVANVVRPHLRDMLRATIGMALQAKQVVMEVAEDLQDIAVDVAADTGTEPVASPDVTFRVGAR